MLTTHIAQDEAISNFGGVIARVRAGEEICIDDDASTIAVVHAPFRYQQPRLLSEAIRGLENGGSPVLLDAKFGDDVEEGIRSREQERLIHPWESS